MPGSPLELSRSQILAFRRRVGALDERLPPGARSLRQAAWAGLQDSMPRAALLSIHARVEGAHPDIWDDKSLVGVWGPRFSTYVVPARDHAIFTVGRHPDDERGRQRAERIVARLHAALGGERMADTGLGVPARYATTTGTVLIRWAGARAPLVWTVPRPEIDPFEARCELARRYLHVFGPGTAESFAAWAGIRGRVGPQRVFDALDLTSVRTPIGAAWILGGDEALIRTPPGAPAAVRLLPSGDAYWLLQTADQRELLVPDSTQRASLWTPRVWPGALLLAGEIAGTWRRAQGKLSVQPWRRLTPAERAAVEAEAQSLPLPGLESAVTVTWETG